MSQHFASRARAHRRLARHESLNRHASYGASALNERAQIIAQLIAASQEVAVAPDSAALMLDGALSQMLGQWAQQAHIHLGDRRYALDLLDERAPAIAWRLRLALQAQNPEARLAHCWALLDLLTTPAAPASHLRHANDLSHERRKDTQSHVS
jgi:hypothetical protein